MLNDLFDMDLSLYARVAFSLNVEERDNSLNLSLLPLPFPFSRCDVDWVQSVDFSNIDLGSLVFSSAASDVKFKDSFVDFHSLVDFSSNFLGVIDSLESPHGESWDDLTKYFGALSIHNFSFFKDLTLRDLPLFDGSVYHSCEESAYFKSNLYSFGGFTEVSPENIFGLNVVKKECSDRIYLGETYLGSLEFISGYSPVSLGGKSVSFSSARAFAKNFLEFIKLNHSFSIDAKYLKQLKIDGEPVFHHDEFRSGSKHAYLKSNLSKLKPYSLIEDLVECFKQ